jgi:hypothetical protein
MKVVKDGGDISLSEALNTLNCEPEPLQSGYQNFEKRRKMNPSKHFPEEDKENSLYLNRSNPKVLSENRTQIVEKQKSAYEEWKMTQQIYSHQKIVAQPTLPKTSRKRAASGSHRHSTAPSLTERTVYPCTDCSMTFMDKAEATKHFISEHNKTEPEQKRTPKIAKRYDRRSLENYIPNITNIKVSNKRKIEVMHQKNMTPNSEKKMMSILKPRFVNVYDKDGRVIGQKIMNKPLPKQESVLKKTFSAPQSIAISMLQNQQNLGSPNQVSIVNQEIVAPVLHKNENNQPITQDRAISNEKIKQNSNLQNQVSDVNQDAVQQVLYVDEYGRPIAQPQYMYLDENGQPIAQPQYMYLDENGQPMAIAQPQYMSVDENGQPIVQPHYMYVVENGHPIAQPQYVLDAAQNTAQPQYMNVLENTQDGDQFQYTYIQENAQKFAPELPTEISQPNGNVAFIDNSQQVLGVHEGGMLQICENPPNIAPKLMLCMNENGEVFQTESHSVSSANQSEQIFEEATNLPENDPNMVIAQNSSKIERKEIVDAQETNTRAVFGVLENKIKSPQHVALEESTQFQEKNIHLPENDSSMVVQNRLDYSENPRDLSDQVVAIPKLQKQQDPKNMTSNPEKKMQPTSKTTILKGRVICEKIADKPLPQQESENRLDFYKIRNSSDQEVVIPKLQSQEPQGVILLRGETEIPNNGTNLETEKPYSFQVLENYKKIAIENQKAILNEETNSTGSFLNNLLNKPPVATYERPGTLRKKATATRGIQKEILKKVLVGNSGSDHQDKKSFNKRKTILIPRRNPCQLVVSDEVLPIAPVSSDQKVRIDTKMGMLLKEHTRKTFHVN